MMEPIREPALPPSDRPGRSDLQRSNLVDQIHDELHRRITDRLMAAGERIIIDKLAAEFGVSLIPVREALARLKVERLVTHESNKGYRVAPAPEGFEMRKLFEARLVVELGALEQGFANLTDALVEQLAAINATIRNGDYGPEFASFRDFIDRNAHFHRLIVGLAQNPFIDEAYSTLGYHQRVAQTLFGRGPDNLDMIVSEHDTIVEALRRRDLAAAKQALGDHIRHGMDPYLT
ncbi:MAG: GntR family transcriptional regulator [Chelatococcus sp.]|uniref:GntR family transcriptional regulator n=1 Tax=Chelatococcus sp. TaxID=1953771 RepID=UPI0025BA5402|nr:GntR family transcriptional regulator [Chelatococcus sp.]MBX3540306.1 GntR family transcriptional regulator [Chelatococcus sp.]